MYNPKKSNPRALIELRFESMFETCYDITEWNERRWKMTREMIVDEKFGGFFWNVFVFNSFKKKKKKDRGILRTKSRFVSIVGIVVVHSSRFNTFKQSCMYIPRYVKFIHGLGRESVSDNSSAITREHRNVGWKCNNARRSNNEIGGRDIEAKDTTGEQN